MRSSSIGLNLGLNWMPRNLSSYWCAEQDRKDSAIRRAKSEEQAKRYEALINSDLMTRFCRRVARKLMEAAHEIRVNSSGRPLTREEDKALDTLLAHHRYYYSRYEYFLSKLDQSAVREIHRHFWYYDEDTGEVVDDDTGIRYKD